MGFDKREISGALDGYVEEMVNGQKVIKVFFHEKKPTGSFEKVDIFRWGYYNKKQV